MARKDSGKFTAGDITIQQYCIWLLSSIISLLLSYTALGQAKIVILGDSLSTGAATHPLLIYDTKALLDLFLSGKRPEALLNDIAPYLDSNQIPEKLTTPLVSWPRFSEFNGSLGWVVKNLNFGLGQHFLNTEEYSWGAFLSYFLGKDGHSLVIAAENGSRMEDTYAQAARVGDELKEAEYLFIFFTGNDLCAPSNDFLSLTLNDYGKRLRDNLNHVFKLLEGRQVPIKVIIPGFLQMQQLMSREEILAKKIMAFGQETSCRELRKVSFNPSSKSKQSSSEPSLFNYLLPPNPAVLCPTVFGLPGANAEQTTFIANKVRYIRDEQKRIVREIQNKGDYLENNRIGLYYLEGTENLLFNGEDISNDCFHLSIAGQAKLARTIAKEMPQN